MREDWVKWAPTVVGTPICPNPGSRVEIGSIIPRRRPSILFLRTTIATVVKPGNTNWQHHTACFEY